MNEIERTVGEKESLFIEIGTVSPTGSIAHVYSILGELPDGLHGTVNFEFTFANGKKIEQASPLQPRFPEESAIHGFRLDFKIPDGMDGGKARVNIEFNSENIIQIPPYEVTLPIKDQPKKETVSITDSTLIDLIRTVFDPEAEAEIIREMEISSTPVRSDGCVKSV